jgi:ribonuclease HI
MPDVKPAIIYTDGACIGNPGPAGAGFVITDQQGNLLQEGCVPLGHGTNNIAEYQAVIAALGAAAEVGATHLIVRSDSELLCRQMSGQYKVKNPGLQKLHIEVRGLMRGFAKVIFEHVPREKNERADALAGEAAKQARRLK